MTPRGGSREYHLLGRDAQRAVETGLASAEWYHTEVSRQDLKALMKRRNAPAIRDTLIWLGALIGFGAAGVLLWPSWWSVPVWLAYGVLYGSAADSRWHECGHATAFKTQWMNTVVYQIASFMIMRNPATWRWSHARHHSDTIIVGRDPEIVTMRPPALIRVGSNFLGLSDAWIGMKDMVTNAAGTIDAAQRTFIPDTQQPKVIAVARVWAAIYAATIASSIALGSILPLLLIGLPRLYGAWHGVLCAITQHTGLAEDVLDHRLNSRTVYMNKVSRFIYWNMNYHVEHHMFPMVPSHALAKLHELIKHDLPRANNSFVDAYREILPALKRQLEYEEYFLKRALPPTAKPYRTEFHDTEPQPALAG